MSDTLLVGKKFVSFDGMAWPRYLEDNDDSVEWRLRYGNPTRADLLYAASVMAAYTALVGSTEKNRKKIVSKLKESENLGCCDAKRIEVGYNFCQSESLLKKMQE